MEDDKKNARRAFVNYLSKLSKAREKKEKGNMENT